MCVFYNPNTGWVSAQMEMFNTGSAPPTAVGDKHQNIDP